MTSDATITEKECKVCGHRWFPRTAEKPRLCPNCKSPRWDKGRLLPERAEMLRAAAERRKVDGIKALFLGSNQLDLQRQSEDMGFSDPVQFVQALIVAATSKTKTELREFLYPGIGARHEVATQEHLEEATSIVKGKRKKSAA